MNEYNLACKGGGLKRMRFCFWCGDRLQESTRGSFFTRPDDGEMAEIHTLLAEAKSLDDVFRILGPPDATRDLGGGIGDSRLGKGYTYQQHHEYSTRWKSLVLKVHARPTRQFGYCIAGHYLGDPGDGARDNGE